MNQRVPDGDGGKGKEGGGGDERGELKGNRKATLVEGFIGLRRGRPSAGEKKERKVC